MNNLVEFKSTYETSAVFSKDMKKRYLLRFCWDEQKPKACIIMTYPSTADAHIIDQTTQLVRNNAYEQGYGSISIVNLFCSLDTEKPESDRANSSVVAAECSNADVVIVAFGRGISHTEQKQKLLEVLKQSYPNKLYTIADSSGNLFAHPLSPKARKWSVQRIA